MKYKAITVLMLFALIATLGISTLTQAQPTTRGPEMDVLRHEVIRMPGPARIAMIAGDDDMNPGNIRTSDIEAQADAGLLVTEDLGFHMGYIAWNIRDVATINENRSDRLHGAMGTVTYWPPEHAEFRHALIHCYDQLAIIPPIYGYVVTPVRSLVPPAQSKYYETSVPAHPYNPGDPLDTTLFDGTNNHDTCSILRAHGFTFQDVGTTGVVDDADYWKCPDGSDMPELVIYTPLYTDAPTSYEHGAEFVADLTSIGLGGTTANGNRGVRNLGWNFDFYLDAVYGTADYEGGNFDAYMVFHSLGRIPDQLYEFLHSSMDSMVTWGQSNGPGVNDATMDALCDTIRFSLDTDDIAAAAKEIQLMMYNPDETVFPNADEFSLAYMLLYSRSLFDAFAADVEGVVRSPGYGADNGWTIFNVNWVAGEPGRYEDVYGDTALESVFKYINGLPPDSLNPTFATTAYEWNIMDPNLEGLTAVNPFNHADIPWIAEDWEITETVSGMEIDFYLRDDVHWADGYLVNASNVEFNLEFFRDYDTINFMSQSLVLDDVVTHNDTWCTVHASEAGLSLFYDYAGTGLVLPPQIWDTTWAGPAEVANYHPEDVVYGTDMGDGTITGHGPYAAKTAWGIVSKNLFGCGPYVYQSYDLVADESELWANRNYFMTQGDMLALMTSMFWEVGDYNTDGIVNVIDLTWTSFAFGTYYLDPGYDAGADYNSDNWVNIADVSNCAYHLLWQREYSAHD
jgi:ABC-type transport system substrate-binding protein